MALPFSLTRRVSDRALFGGWLLFLFALAVRLLYLIEWHDTPFFRTVIGDGLRYHRWALEIAGGNWLGKEVFYQAPLYPYFLGALYTVFGDGLWVARIAQAVLGAGACVLMWRFARRAFSPAAGWLAGIGLALYPPAIFSDGILQKTTLTGFLLAASLYLYVRLAGERSTRRPPGVALLLGVALALLSLAQEHLMLLVPLLAGFLLLRPAPPGAQRLLPVLALVTGLAIVFVPIGLRNQAIGGTFLITTSQFGPNFWLGNNPRADGHYHAMREGRGDAEFERQDAAELAMQARGRPLTPSGVSAYWLERSLEFIREQPLVWLGLSLKKWHLVWHGRELPDTDSLSAYADQSRILAWLSTVWNFGVLVPLAFAGIVLRWRSARQDAWLHAAMLAVSLGVAAFIVYARYRYALALLLMPFAAHAVVVAGRAVWRMRAGQGGTNGAVGLREAVVAVCALVAGAVMTHWPLPARDMRAVNYYSVAARILDGGGSLADAETMLTQTVAIAPNEAYPYFALSVVYKRRGEFAREVGALRKGLALAPGIRAGYDALAEAERRAAAQRRNDPADVPSAGR